MKHQRSKYKIEAAKLILIELEDEQVDIEQRHAELCDLMEDYNDVYDWEEVLDRLQDDRIIADEWDNIDWDERNDLYAPIDDEWNHPWP